MKKIKLFSLAAVAMLSLAGIVSCGGGDEPTPDPDDPTLETVRVGLHTNYGAGAGYSVLNQGFMREEGINMVPTTGAGPALATSLVEGNLDVSFMGGGVAYHYFATNPKVKIVALDNLTDDDRLMANPSGPGKDLTTSSSLTEIGNAMKGATVALDFNQTPATFLSTLLTAINEELPAGQQLWYTNSTGDKLPAGLSSYSADCEFQAIQADNQSLATSASSYDFCIAYAPAATLIEQRGAMKVVCKTSTHFADSYAPSTWAVNVEWLNTHEETFKKFMRGLVKGMNFRRDNPEKCAQDIEDVTSGSVAADTLATDIAVWLGDKEQIELDESGNMKKYTENIRQGQLAGQNGDLCDPNTTVDKASDFSYLLDACEAILAE